MEDMPAAPDLRRLRDIGPEIYPLESDQVFWRVYFAEGAHPSEWDTFRHFGPTTARFDHHLESSTPPFASTQARGVTYLAADGPTCIAEVFQRSAMIDRFTDTPWLVGFTVSRPLRLLDLTSAWPTRAGASQIISSGKHKIARSWSRAIYEAYTDVDGLAYSSSMNAGLPSFAFYERAKDALPEGPPFHRPLAHRDMTGYLNNAAIKFNYALR